MGNDPNKCIVDCESIDVFSANGKATTLNQRVCLKFGPLLLFEGRTPILLKPKNIAKRLGSEEKPHVQVVETAKDGVSKTYFIDSEQFKMALA